MQVAKREALCNAFTWICRFSYRYSEIANLKMENIIFFPSYIVVNIVSGKTDVYRVIGSFFIIGLLKVRFPPSKNTEISLSSHGFECKLRS
jgi:hypothetical protein